MPYFSTYTPTPSDGQILQSHVHISPDQDETGNIENAFHDHTQWSIRDRLPQPNLIMSIKRTLNHRLRVHVANSGAGPIQLRDYKLTIICKPQHGLTAYDRVEQLAGMSGYTVYFIDVYHPDADDDHAPYVKRMFLEVGDLPTFDPALQRYEVDITLTDDNVGFTP